MFDAKLSFSSLLNWHSFPRTLFSWGKRKKGKNSSGKFLQMGVKKAAVASCLSQFRMYIT
jgi:hypothetical protein